MSDPLMWGVDRLITLSIITCTTPNDVCESDTETTTVHTAKVVRYDDPVIITERVAVAAFIAGYNDPTRVMPTSPIFTVPHMARTCDADSAVGR